MALLLYMCRFNITRKHMEQLVESIQSLGYHYVMIDCPAGIDVGFINAISPAKEALIVTTPEITSIRCDGQGQRLPWQTRMTQKFHLWQLLTGRLTAIVCAIHSCC